MTIAVVPVRTKSIRRAEREFLPAALEIVETPPSPIGRLGAYCLVVVFALAIVWAWFGRVDIVAVAKGKIIPTGHTKIVQPFEIGVVRAILVHDGQKVKVGDVLIELDPTMNQADLDHQRSDLMAARIDIARLTAALESENDADARFVPPAGASPEQARMGEQFLIGQMSQYRSKLASSRRRRGAEAGGTGKSERFRSARSRRGAAADGRTCTQMRKTLFDHQTGTKLAYLENLQELLSNQKDLGGADKPSQGSRCGGCRVQGQAGRSTSRIPPGHPERFWPKQPARQTVWRRMLPSRSSGQGIRP